MRDDVFTHAHIAFTAACTGVIAFGVGVWRFRGHAVGSTASWSRILVGGAVYLWRASANMPQLNNDGIPGYSANDWLAPAITLRVTQRLRRSLPADRPSAGSHKYEPPPPSPPSPVNVITI